MNHNDPQELDAHKDEGSPRGVGLEELVLAVLELLHELVEKQVLRRMDAGHFSDEQLEKLGQAIFAQDTQIDKLCELFSIERDSLDVLKILDTKGLSL